jgi:excisionase family DNA binding protein
MDMRQHTMAELLTTKQVQEMLRVDRTTIYRMVEQGRLPAIRVGKQWRFRGPEIDSWLQGQVMEPLASGADPATTTEGRVNADQARQNQGLHNLLPLACVQLIQDAFADILGVMMVVTDMDGRPVTQLSNPCGLYAALMHGPDALRQCIHTWQQLAVAPALLPRFSPSEMGLLCARGVVRVGSALKGMVVVGGIAPAAWPPSPEECARLAATFGVDRSLVDDNYDAVYHLDSEAQAKTLYAVQRIADIISHIAEDRNALCGRLQAIAALTTFA